MLIPLLDLILYFNKELNLVENETGSNYYEVCSSTLAYLNCYRQTEAMLKDLAKDVTDIKCQAGGS